MIKVLQNMHGVNVDATKKAKVEMKRGTFVKANEETGELEIATETADVTGVVVRDVVVDDDVAQGLPVSEWADSQDIIKVGEFCGHRVIQKGEIFATDQYGDTVALPEADAKAGKVLDVANGKLVKAVASSSSKIVSLGFMQIAGHKMLGFKLV